MTKYLFVYGTLLPDRLPAGLAHIRNKLRFVARGRTRGRLYDFGDFPGAVFDASARTMVSGIVYEILGASNLLRALDAYEGFDQCHPASSLFLRKQRRIRLEDGRKLLSWVYEYNGDPSSRVQLPK